MTQAYKRIGTTTLFALNILDGTVVGRCMRKHTHKDFIKFFNAAERAVPAGKIIHAIADNYATHKNPNVIKWLADHRRWTFHFMPTSASLAQCCRRIFLDHHAPKNSSRRLQIRRRALRRHRAIQQGAQQNLKAVRLDCLSHRHLRKARENPCTF
jgi:hypothetical protein